MAGVEANKMLSYPVELKYTKTHEYIRVEPGSEAYVGVTAFAAEQLGDVTYVELPEVGAKLKKAEKFGVIESVKSVSDLFMPVSGEITAVNERLSSEPELVNLDCYGNGWLVKVKLQNATELNDVLSADNYRAFILE